MKYNSKAITILRSTIYIVLPFLLFLLFMEVGLRCFHGLKFFANSFGRVTRFSDDLGWEPVPNMSFEREVKGYGKVKYTTVEHGFRVFGDPDTDKIKIFVIGDSVTQAYTVSDGEAYYDYLKKHNDDIEIFAYGGGGFGSFQEYMVLDRYFDEIKPDIIVWQFSDNDIVNNLHEMESTSFANNNHMVRPYYIDGRIMRLYPKRTDGLVGLVYRLGKHSRLFRFIDIRLDILKAEKIGSIEREISEAHPLMKKAVRTTSDIMGLVRKRAGGTPVVTFSVSMSEWLGNAFPDISAEHGFYNIRGIPEAIKAAKDSGVRVDGLPYDGHWNGTAHGIAGRIILDYLNENNLLI